MKINLILLFTCLTISSYSQEEMSNTISKENKVRILAELKEYTKNPQLFLDEQEAQNLIIKGAKEEVESLKAQQIRNTKIISILADSISKVNAERQRLISEINELRQNRTEEIKTVKKAKPKPVEPEPEEVAVKPEPVKHRSESTVELITTGRVYKIQLGSFGSFTPTGFEGKRTLETERAETTNRFLIGNFTNMEEAKKAVEDFKKLGVTNSYVVEYLDGKRIK